MKHRFYDQLSRLLTANYDGGAVEYTYGYDLAGNLVNNNGTTRTYNAANQMVNDGTNTLTYDANGNLTNDGVNSYTWDRANRMLTAPGSTSYKYDGASNRIQQTVSSVVTDYLNDVQPGLVKLLRQTVDGTDVDHFVHAPRGIHAVDDGTDWSWFTQDGLGSVRGIVDSDAVVQSSMAYDPYGVPDGAYGAGFGYAGEVIDGNGLSYNRARYYSPDFGTWMSLDIVETPNRYAYVSGNPINLIDATGLLNWCTGEVDSPQDTLGIIYSAASYSRLPSNLPLQQVMRLLGEANVGNTPLYREGIGNYNITLNSGQSLLANGVTHINIPEEILRAAGITCPVPAIPSVDCPPDTLTPIKDWPPIAPVGRQPQYEGDCWSYCEQIHPINEDPETLVEPFTNCVKSCLREHYSSCWDRDHLDELDVKSVGRIVGLDLYFIGGGGVSYLEMWDATGGDRHMRFLIVEAGLGFGYDFGLVGAILNKIAGRFISGVTSEVLSNVSGGGHNVWSEASMDEIAGWSSGYSASLAITGTTCTQSRGADGDSNVTTSRGFSLGFGGSLSGAYTFVLTDNHR